MSRITLYLDYISQPARTVLCFCLLAGIPVAIEEVRVNKLEHLSSKYEAINPMKKVPAIYDHDTALGLGESHTIIKYLLHKFQLTTSLYPSNHSLRAKIDQYLDYHHANTRKCAYLVFNQLFSHVFQVKRAFFDPSSARNQIEAVLQFINHHYFKESNFLLGNSMTLADLSAFFEIETLDLLDFDWKPYTNLERWMVEMRKNQFVQKTDEKFKAMSLRMKSKKTVKAKL